MTDICIVAAKRSVHGRFMGKLKRLSAVELATTVGKELLGGIAPSDVDQVIVGNIIAAGQGMNIARQVSVALEIPIDRTAFTVNMMCASGLQAVLLGAQAIRAGEAKVVVCGGTESMSNAPYLLDRARSGYRLGDGVLVDAMLRDGLVDTFSGRHMGLTAELIAEEFGIDREAQDAFALRSQHNWAAAHKENAFAAELVEAGGLEHDEHPRPETTMEQMADMKPAFKPDGTVTAANASGINDGAALMVVCSLETADRCGWRPLARIGGSASVGCEPDRMALGPVHATRKLSETTSYRVGDFESIEMSEAFAVQALACIRELDLDPERVNPHGGAVALGHPIGATGARLLVHLAQRIAQGDLKRGLATLCVGGGMGCAVALEAV